QPVRAPGQDDAIKPRSTDPAPSNRNNPPLPQPPHAEHARRPRFHLKRAERPQHRRLQREHKQSPPSPDWLLFITIEAASLPRANPFGGTGAEQGRVGEWEPYPSDFIA